MKGNYMTTKLETRKEGLLHLREKQLRSIRREIYEFRMQNKKEISLQKISDLKEKEYKRQKMKKLSYDIKLRNEKTNREKLRGINEYKKDIVHKLRKFREEEKRKMHKKIDDRIFEKEYRKKLREKKIQLFLNQKEQKRIKNEKIDKEYNERAIKLKKEEDQYWKKRLEEIEKEDKEEDDEGEDEEKITGKLELKEKKEEENKEIKIENFKKEINVNIKKMKKFKITMEKNQEINIEEKLDNDEKFTDDIMISLKEK